MANRGLELIRAFLSRRLSTDPAPSTALVKIKQQPTSLVKRDVTGFNAGLPQGNIVDPVLKTTGAIPLRGEAPTAYQTNGTTVRIRGFERHPVVQACVRAIVDIGSAVPLQVYKKKAANNSTGFSDEIEVQTSKHPLQQLVDAPNSFLSAQRFRAFMMTHYVIYGNTLTYLERPDSSEPINTKPPTSLRIVHPEDILTVYVNYKGYPLWYMWRDTLGYMHTSPVQDLLHVRDLNAKGLVFGYPRAASALNDIIGDDEASQFVRQTVTNTGQAGVWLLANENTTPSEAKIVEDQLYEQMVARGGRGRTKVIGGIDDVKSVAFSLKDLEFPDLRRVAREDICAAFGVDPRMVGITSATKDAGLSGQQYTEARVRLIKQTVEPLMRAMESEMNLWLAPEFGDVYLRFDPDALAAMAEDKDGTSKRVLAEMAAGARTIEETREVLELNPDFDEDDTLAIAMGTTITPVMIAMQPPMQGAVGTDGKPLLDDQGKPVMVPQGTLPADVPTDDKVEDPTDIGTSTSAKPKPQNEKDLQKDEGQDPNNKGKQPKLNDGASDPKPKRAKKDESMIDVEALRAMLPVSLIQKRGMVLTPEQRVNLWRQFDSRAVSDEAKYKRQAMILFGEERSNVARIFDHQQAAAGEDPSAEVTASHVKAAKRQIRMQYKSGGDVSKRWTDRFHPLIGGTFAKGADQIVTALKKNRAELRKKKAPKKGPHAATESPAGTHVGFDFHLQNPNVQAAIRGRAERLAEHVSDTTAETITDAIEIGLREGMTLPEIAKLVDRTAFGSNAGYRAEMIARTETVGALNQGEHDTAVASGEVAGKEWLTQGDDKVRDSHAEDEDEGMIGLDDTFEASGMLYPGDPDGDADEVINCRCTLLFYDTLEEGASSIDDGAMSSMASRLDRLERADDIERSRAGGVADALAAVAKQPAPVVNVDVHLPARGPVKSTRTQDGSVITEELPLKIKD